MLRVDGGVGVGFPRSRGHVRVGSLCWNGAVDGVGGSVGVEDDVRGVVSH